MSNDPTKGGKGKKAPYETQHYRIPVPIRQAVEDLSNAFKYMCAKGRETDELLREVRTKVAEIYYPTDEKVVPAKSNNTQALEIDKLKAEIDILKQTLANKQQEIELFKTMTQDRKAIARDLVGEYLNGKEMPKTRNWVEMNKFKHWLSDT